VELRLGEASESITPNGDGVVVRTESGSCLGADAVVVAIGIDPCAGVAMNSGIAVDNGIPVDASGRTSVPNVFAAGDVANHYHPLFERRIRAEHVDSATRLATVAADTMLGRQAAFDAPHWFYSDQYGRNLQFAGDVADCDDIVVRGTVSDMDFCAFYLREGAVRAAFGIERGMDVMAAKELISKAARVDPAALSDENVDLFELSMEGVS
jgi:3-phenylpropionate/trans-cinnamate dioxygenase ferredoxin reductase subunit